MQSILTAPSPNASPTVSRSTPIDHKMAEALPCSPLASKRAGEAAFDVGLVSSETKGPETPQAQQQRLILVDRHEARIKRLRRSVLTAARLHCQQRKGWKVCMVTLTYAPENDWAPGQIGHLIRSIRKYLRRKDIELCYDWVQEFTKRGKPHYHLLIWLPRGITLPKPDKRGWWPYGMTKIEWAYNAIGYIAKYASKGDSLHRPEVGARMHGNGGLKGDALLEARWWKLPAWARENSAPSDRLRRRASGGGILNPMTGEILLTPWRVLFLGGQVYIYRVDDIELQRCQAIAERISSMQ
jgi:hypothetical protein